MNSENHLPIRAKEVQRALSDEETSILHKNLTNFIREIACQATEKVILNPRVINLNDAQYAEFINMLDMPFTANPAFEALQARKPQWEQ